MCLSRAVGASESRYCLKDEQVPEKTKYREHRTVNSLKCPFLNHAWSLEGKERSNSKTLESDLSLFIREENHIFVGKPT